MGDRYDWERDRRHEDDPRRERERSHRGWPESARGDEGRNREERDRAGRRGDRDWSGENPDYSPPERPDQYAGRSDWGNQGSWGSYGTRAAWTGASDRENRGTEWRRLREEWDRRQRGPYAGRGPKGWRRSDERILEEINERLTDHPAIDATEVEVTVHGGEATLTGTVEDRNSKRLAEDIADSVSGVTEVHNQLRIQAGVNRQR